MFDLSEIINNGKTLKLAKYESTKQALISFAIYLLKLPLTVEKLTKSNMRCRIELSTNTCAKILQDVDVNEIPVEYTVQIFRSLDNSKSINTFLKFVIFATETGIITDDRYKRLLVFKDSFFLHATVPEITYMLEEAEHKYNVIMDSGIRDNTSDKNAYQLYFLSIDTSRYIDTQIATAVQAGFFDVKLLKEFTAGSRNNLCFAYRYFADKMLKDITSAEITPAYLLEQVQTTANNRKQSYKVFVMLINALIRYGIKLCEEVESLFKVLTDHGAMSESVLLTALASKHFDRWVYLPMFKKNIGRFMYINIDSEEVRGYWNKFMETYEHNDSIIRKVCNELQESFGSYTVNYLKDLNYYTFVQQIKYFGKYNKVEYLAPISAFYSYISINYNPDIFTQSGVDSKVLLRVNVAQEIADGYIYIPYNPMDKIPDEDKWLFSYSDMTDTNATEISGTTSKLIDFTQIECREYRYWYKHYLWHNSAGLGQRLHVFPILKYALNYIYGIKTGKIVAFTAKKTDDLTITTSDAFTFKNHILSIRSNNRTRNGYIYGMRNLLNHINDCDLSIVERGIFVHLSFTLSSDYDNTKAIPNEELNKLARLMKENTEVSTVYALYYAIFYIALETEFRPSQILALKRDCIQETAKPNEYVLISKTKTSAGEMIEQPITIYVKKHIDEIAKLSNEYRDECNINDLRDYLFIQPGVRMHTYRHITPEKVNSYLRDCCAQLGIPKYNMSNLRDTHMTKAEEFVIRNQLSDLEQTILSGHRSSNVDTKHYTDISINEMLEAVHGVIIGNVTVEGQILKEVDASIATVENEVSNSCGYCSSKQCNNFSYLDCMLCKNFVTIPSRLPYFEEQVKVIDAKIQNAKILHDKEDLVNIKLLLLHYVEEILKLKEVGTNG